MTQVYILATFTLCLFVAFCVLTAYLLGQVWSLRDHLLYLASRVVFKGEEDPLEQFLDSRDFYEICQFYRHSKDEEATSDYFNSLKSHIVLAAKGEHKYWFKNDEEVEI